MKNIAFGRKAWHLPPPAILSIWMDALKGLCTSIIVAVNASTVLSPHAAGMVSLICGILIGVSEAAKKLIGQKPLTTTP